MTKIIINDKYNSQHYQYITSVDLLSKISDKWTAVIYCSDKKWVEIYDIKNFKSISKSFENYLSEYESYWLYVFSDTVEDTTLKYNSTWIKQVFNNSWLQILKDFNDEDNIDWKHRFWRIWFEKEIYTVTTKNLWNSKYQHNLSILSYETWKNIQNITIENEYNQADLISFSKAGYFEIWFNASYWVWYELTKIVDSNWKDQVHISSILNNWFLAEFLGEAEYSIKNPFTWETFWKYSEVGDYSEWKCIVEKLKRVDNNISESNYIVIDEKWVELFKLPEGIRSANNFKYKNGYLIFSNLVIDSEWKIVMTIDDDNPQEKKSVKFSVWGNLVIKRSNDWGEWYETLHTASWNEVSDNVEWFEDANEGLRSFDDSIIFAQKDSKNLISLKKFPKKDFFPELDILGTNSIKVNDVLFRIEKNTSNIELLSSFWKLTEMTDLWNSVEINWKKFSKKILKLK